MLGIAKTFGVTEKYALYEMSYLNAIMYSRAMPMPHDGEDSEDAPAYDERLDMCNPDNVNSFNNFDEDEEVVRI